MTGDRARHQLRVDAIGKQLEPGHIGARPADAGKHAEAERLPESARERGEPEVADHRQRNPGKIDLLRVEAIGQRDEDRDGEDIGTVERAGNCAGLPIAQRPGVDELRQQRGPGVSADLREDLGATDEQDEAAHRSM